MGIVPWRWLRFCGCSAPAIHLAPPTTIINSIMRMKK